MKLRLKHSGLILGLALLLLSCEDPGTIGLDVDGDNLEFKVFYERFELPTTLVQIDSIPTTRTGRILSGRYQDDKFGLVDAIGYGEAWVGPDPVIDSAAVYDSLVLQLKYSYVHGLDIQAENHIQVHQLEEKLDDFATYYNFSQLTYSVEPIGEVRFAYPLEASGEIVEFDTTLRVPLSDALGNEFFEKMIDEDDTTFSSIAAWREYFHGIVLKPGDTYESVTGFDPTSPDSRMVLYYHFVDDDGETQNRAYNFSMQQGVHFNNINYSREGSQLSNVTEFFTEYSALDEMIYVQSGTGLVAKIDFSPYLEFTDTIQNLIVNRADFTIGMVESYPEYIRPPAQLIYYLTDSTNRRITNENGEIRAIQVDSPAIDPSGTRSPLQAEYDGSDEQYSDLVSSHVQALYDGTIEETTVVAYPVFGVINNTIDRFIVDPQNVILEVYYSTADTNSSSN